ncbi:MAG: epoxide hydrolase, partial [Chloroflexales bacterium]|nr:epoxide hydrolase [Chloroflexales bacterium]
NVERRFTKDELLTNIMIYWATETINSSMRGYYEGFHAEADAWGQAPQRVEAPVGLALFPKDNPAPREMAERFFNLQRWSELPCGGHFAALEEPELVVEELRAFFRPLRPAA